MPVNTWLIDKPWQPGEFVTREISTVQQVTHNQLSTASASAAKRINAAEAGERIKNIKSKHNIQVGYRHCVAVVPTVFNRH